MDSIGDILRRERLRRGLKLEQVSAHTKIGQQYLLAMEENRFERLPGGLFTRSFLQQYTYALDLDPEEVMASLKQQCEEPPVALSEPQPQYRPSHLPLLPAAAWLVIVTFGCGGIYTLWENVRRSLFETSVFVPRPMAHSGRASLAPRATPAPAELPQPELHPVEELSRSSSPRPGFGPRDAALHVVFAASEPVWLSIKSDGIPTYRGTIEGLQSRAFDAATKMVVLVGNAGGVRIAVNGKPVGMTGAHGEVQSLVVTPGGVQVAPRMPPPTLATPDEHGVPIEKHEHPS
jgi:transcriptional regulator with XRE-family HTH domain